MRLELRDISRVALFGASIAAVVASGCSSSVHRATMTPHAPTDRNLVMLDPWLSDAHSYDEESLASAHVEHLTSSARNDDRLGVWAPDSGVESVEWLEVRSRDYLRTINGRPREFSTTQTRSIKRGFVR